MPSLIDRANVFLTGEELAFEEADQLWNQFKKADYIRPARAVLSYLHQGDGLSDNFQSDQVKRQELCRQEAKLTSKAPELNAATRHDLALDPLGKEFHFNGVKPTRYLPVLAQRLFAVCLALLCFVGCSTSRQPASNAAHSVGDGTPWQLFEGAWFTIEFPADFTVKPSLMDSDSGQYDSVFFVAPGNDASFYVLSPQWRREPLDIAFQPGNEVELERFDQTEANWIKTTRLIRAQDATYTRLIESYSTPDQTVSWIFQFFYTQNSTRKNYSNAFAHFKLSLKQYSD